MASNPPFVAQPFTSADRIMWITPDRVFYAGLLGSQCTHICGAIIAYVAIDGLLRVRIDGEDRWQTTEVAVIQPHVPYQIACDGRHVLSVSIEPETVVFDQLPLFLQNCGEVHATDFAAFVRATHRQLLSQSRPADLRPSDFDDVFFGQRLPARVLDGRITKVLESIRDNPTEVPAAADCASSVNLSFSRFLHLFKDEVGTSFRNVRTWKRARNLLHHVHADSNLLNVALDIGYPDSTHFSHSIRKLYGLKPKDIIAGSRKLRVISHPVAH